MIITVDQTGAVSLTEADNFRGFKVASSLADPAALGQALRAAGRFDGEHAWIERSWLVAQAGGGAEWAAGFEKMMAFAQSKGWVADDAIRAHIEYVS